MKRLMARAVERIGAATELTMQALSGPLLRKRKNSATKTAGTSDERGPKIAAAAAGTAISMLHAESRYRPRWFLRSQRWPSHPPATVPRRPSMAVMAPVTSPAAATEYPAKRTKNVGRKG